ncbi:hypothetical protein [Halobacteriovorax sp. RT-1-4]|uniref:PD-(D/E)XK nuclease domain-containing protein n=1 Tax=unclassified Halobacteriovorax TaxID=2639665 RepID=UPI0039995CAD
MIDNEEVREYLKKAIEHNYSDLGYWARENHINSGYFDKFDILDSKYAGLSRDLMFCIMGHCDDELDLEEIPNTKFASMKDFLQYIEWLVNFIRSKIVEIEECQAEYEEQGNRSPIKSGIVPTPIVGAVKCGYKFQNILSTAVDLIKNNSIFKSTDADDRFDLVVKTLQNLEEFSKVLKETRRADRGQKRQCFDINDEYDVQDLLYSILSIYFDDVRVEEPLTSFSKGKSRCDLFIPEISTLIEVKTTLKKSSKDISSDFKNDIPDYLGSGKCKRLILFTYDPNSIVSNKGAFNDLKKIGVDGSDCEIIIIFT